MEGELLELSNFAVGLARRTAPFLGADLAVEEGRQARWLIFTAGIATFGFGFLAGALLNLYLWAVHATVAEQFRTTLTYPSAILGDGLVLPIVNMTAAAFLLRRRRTVGRGTVALSVLMGIGVTLYFHINQAVNGIVNWSMPTPWHWNLLGLYHGIYMLWVCAFLSLFLLVTVRTVRREGSVPREALIVGLGVIVFFGLLRLDYAGLELPGLWLGALFQASS